jgi:hypothetical protein
MPFLDTGLHMPLTDMTLHVTLADAALLGQFHVAVCYRFPADRLLWLWLALRAFAFWSIPL